MNRPFSCKASGMQALLEYILSMYHAHFTYISMEIILYFDPHAPHCGASYTGSVNISQKNSYSFTLGKLSSLLKMILHWATTIKRQNKQFLLSTVRHKRGISVTDSSGGLFSLLAITKSDIRDSIGHWTCSAHLFFKNTNKHVSAHFSTSSLITNTKKFNGLLLLVNQASIDAKYSHDHDHAIHVLFKG